jgi:hypothetical protein
MRAQQRRGRGTGGTGAIVLHGAEDRVISPGMLRQGEADEAVEALDDVSLPRGPAV